MECPLQLATENGIPPSSSPEGTNTLASGSDDKTVIIWDVATEEQKAQLKPGPHWGGP